MVIKLAKGDKQTNSDKKGKTFFGLSKRKKMKQIARQRETKRNRGRQRETDRDREKQRKTVRDREKQREKTMRLQKALCES